MARSSRRKASARRVEAAGARAAQASGTRSASSHARGTAADSAARAHLSLVAEQERLERLVSELGNNRVAELMGVTRSQPSRWRSGRERPGPQNQRRLIDLDYVFGRLLQLYPREQAEIWLRSHNAHLGGRPVDVLRIHGAVPVIEAIDAEAEGAFA